MTASRLPLLLAFAACAFVGCDSGSDDDETTSTSSTTDAATSADPGSTSGTSDASTSTSEGESTAGDESSSSGFGSSSSSGASSSGGSSSTGEASDTPPELVITLPKMDMMGNDGPIYDAYDEVSELWYADVELAATATDAEDGDLGVDVEWRTDQVGVQAAELGTGDTITVRLYSNVCTGLTHTITATVTDSDGNEVSAPRVLNIWTLC